MIIDVTLLDWDESPTIRRVSPSYKRRTAEDYRDKPARLTPRQATFYKNLIEVALKLGSSEIPVDFQDASGNHYYLDRGCIKIAEHARFIQPIQNDASGTVGTVLLNWVV